MTENNSKLLSKLIVHKIIGFALDTIPCRDLFEELCLQEIDKRYLNFNRGVIEYALVCKVWFNIVSKQICTDYLFRSQVKYPFDFGKRLTTLSNPQSVYRVENIRELYFVDYSKNNGVLASDCGAIGHSHAQHEIGVGHHQTHAYHKDSSVELTTNDLVYYSTYLNNQQFDFTPIRRWRVNKIFFEYDAGFYDTGAVHYQSYVKLFAIESLKSIEISKADYIDIKELKLVVNNHVESFKGRSILGLLSHAADEPIGDCSCTYGVIDGFSVLIAKNNQTSEWIEFCQRLSNNTTLKSLSLNNYCQDEYTLATHKIRDRSTLQLVSHHFAQSLMTNITLSTLKISCVVLDQSFYDLFNNTTITKLKLYNLDDDHLLATSKILKSNKTMRKLNKIIDFSFGLPDYRYQFEAEYRKSKRKGNSNFNRDVIKYALICKEWLNIVSKYICTEYLFNVQPKYRRHPVDFLKLSTAIFSKPQSIYRVENIRQLYFVDYYKNIGVLASDCGGKEFISIYANDLVYYSAYFNVNQFDLSPIIRWRVNKIYFEYDSGGHDTGAVHHQSYLKLFAIESLKSIEISIEDYIDIKELKLVVNNHIESFKGRSILGLLGHAADEPIGDCSCAYSTRNLATRIANNNQTSDWIAFCQQLSNNMTLKTISLNNYCRDEETLSIHKIRDQSTLQLVSHHFAQSLMSNSTLSTLKISCVVLDQSFYDVFINNNNTTITKLKLYNLEDDHLLATSKILKSNKTIRKLNVRSYFRYFDYDAKKERMKEYIISIDNIPTNCTIMLFKGDTLNDSRHKSTLKYFEEIIRVSTLHTEMIERV
ncbi:hypothetical protein PPL_05950 [Heterostelium album PN500]|uniref:Uncharacterized protein n=1 Tax=Heterostelium pallidum (strain ATCC 26659 / Pp 5 / PN500) TaxID=670386 RepID=D3BBT1_HETP5|nr:hypothetical protein PPL_05950 [Heterostelium album PN500]EFA81114.1 hypothetical protein PPL_05950 [Heterostelium album PN500]|eukprot:XP_020433232.1 hypothetical protein PPL_05950 [Heterostelium album PN500]